MQNWITDFMEQYGYIGIALIIALENVFPRFHRKSSCPLAVS